MEGYFLFFFVFLWEAVRLAHYLGTAQVKLRSGRESDPTPIKQDMDPPQNKDHQDSKFEQLVMDRVCSFWQLNHTNQFILLRLQP